MAIVPIIWISKYYPDLKLLFVGVFLYPVLILMPWDISRISHNRIKKYLKTFGIKKKYTEEEIEYAYKKTEEEFVADFWNLGI